MSKDGKTVSVALANEVEAMARVVEMKYPDYQSVIPKESNHSLVIDRKALVKAVKQASVLSDDRYQGSLFTFNGGLTITATNPDKGEYGKENLEMEGVVNPEIEFGLNPKYIANVLEHMKDEKVNIGLSETTKPVVFTEGDFLGLVMPMRI